MSENRELFALLIDGDNAQSAFIPQIFRELSKYGEPRVSRVFHNKATIEQWEQVAREYPVEPIWVPNNITQKNSIDIALVMDAMVLFYERPEITGFCIVASDSDYTRLARHLKSQGKYVVGIGRKQTPIPFTNACTEFIYVENLLPSLPITSAPVTPVKEVPASVETISPENFIKAIVKAYKQIIQKGPQDQQGRVSIRELKEAVAALDPVFSSPDYQQMPKFVSQVKMLANKYPDKFTVHEQQDSKPVMHYLHIELPQKETAAAEVKKFRQAYRHAVDLKQSDAAGWVSLSAIGSVLHKLYPNFDPLVYQNVRSGQLTKVVERMRADYPHVIELKIQSKQPHIRIR